MNKKFKMLILFWLLWGLISNMSAWETFIEGREHVILLHGLARSKTSMAKLGRSLEKAGFYVHNVQYPSRSSRIEEMADKIIEEALNECRKQKAQQIHFVTHSMGGILIRYYLQNHTIDELGRVVMLAPPNQGSEVVDKLQHWSLFEWWNGPAGMQLGTHSQSLPIQLPEPDFSVGIIAGDRSWNWWLSSLIPGCDDGKVAIERTQMEGMTDFLVVHSSHTFIMKKRKVIQETIRFLKTGTFSHESSKND